VRALAVAVVVLVSGVGFAQEIGTEIEPVGPKAPPPVEKTPPPPTNPYATTPPPETATPESPAVTPPPQKTTRGRKAPESMGAKASAGAMSVGVHTALGGSGLSLTDAGPSPTVGMTFFATDQVALTFDVGLGLQFSNRGLGFGFGAGVGMVFALGTPEDVLRPIIVAQVLFGKTVSQQSDDFMLVGQVGGGAEYFFSKNFSVSAQMLAGVPVNFRSGELAIFTFSPGLGATLYF